MDGKSRIPQSL